MSKVTIGCKMIGVDVLSKSLNPSPIVLTEDEINFWINSELKINVENTLLLLVIDLKVTPIAEEYKDYELAKLSYGFRFLVPQLKDFIIIYPDIIETKFPELFLDRLNMISVGAVRGLAYEFFNGTYLHNLVLPLSEIDMGDLKLLEESNSKEHGKKLRKQQIKTR